MNKTQKTLIYLNKVYNANWDKMFNSISKKEKHDEDKIKSIEGDIRHPYITLIDDNYPNRLKNSFKPPFVLFYEGDISLLDKRNLLYVFQSNTDTTDYSNIIKSVIDDYTIISGYDNPHDEEILRIAMMHNKKFILVLDESLDEMDCDDEIILYALRNNCLILTEIGFSNDNVEYSTNSKYRLIAPFISGAFILSAKRTDLKIALLVDSVISANGNIFCLPQPPFTNSINNQLIKDGALLVDTLDDIRPIYADE